MSGNTFDPIEELKARGVKPPEAIETVTGTADTVAIAVEQTGQLDPNGKDPHQAGAKLDAGKVPVWRGVMKYFGPALLAVGAVSEFGSKKYTWGGWKSVEDGHARYSDAMFRHAIAEADGERYDPETGLLHSAQVAWNALARLVLELKDHPLRRP